MKKSMLLFFLGVFLCALAGAQNKPVWVDNPSALYPEDSYVSAVGAGNNRTAAENNAKAALAAYFRQSVSSRVTIVDTAQEVNGRSSSRSDMSQSIEASSALDALMGAEIKGVWQDKKEKTGWRAVAVMEKAPGRERYAAELNKLIAEVKLLSDISAGVSFDTQAKCRSARELLPRAELYALVLSMLGGPERQQELSQLAAKVDGALREAGTIPVDIRVTGDRGGRLRSVFAQPFTSRGFRTGSRNSRYVLDVGITLERLAPGKYFNTRYALDAVLKDTRTGTELFTYNIEDRESHPGSQAGADDRAFSVAVELAGKEFPGLLQNYLDSMTP